MIAPTKAQSGQKLENWEERFDNRYKDIKIWVKTDQSKYPLSAEITDGIKDIKSFIAQELAAQKQAIVKRIRELKEAEDDGCICTECNGVKYAYDKAIEAVGME